MRSVASREQHAATARDYALRAVEIGNSPTLIEAAKVEATLSMAAAISEAAAKLADNFYRIGH
jgi:hypothetical protein